MLADALPHVDPDRLAGVRDRDLPVVELEPVDALMKVGRVTLEVQKIPDPDGTSFDLDDRRVHALEVVRHPADEPFLARSGERRRSSRGGRPA